MTTDQIWKMCKRKRRLSRGDAERKAFWRGMRSYHCPICHRYHLTKVGGALY